MASILTVNATDIQVRMATKNEEEIGMKPREGRIKGEGDTCNTCRRHNIGFVVGELTLGVGGRLQDDQPSH